MVGGGGAEGVPTPVTLSTLTIEAARAPQRVGTTQQLTAIATFSDHTTRDVTSCATWTSDQTRIVIVTQSGGRETALTPGDATVFASFRAFGKTATASISVQVTAAPAWPKTVESAILQRELFLTPQSSRDQILNRRTTHVANKTPERAFSHGARRLDPNAERLAASRICAARNSSEVKTPNSKLNPTRRASPNGGK